MDLTDLKPAPGAKKNKKREGRGRAGYGGKTAGRGHNGQQQRAGGAIRKQFEGGQTPLYRRLPKHQYISLPNRKDYTVINLATLQAYGLAENSEVTPEYLLEKRLIKKLGRSGLKILAQGELSTRLNIKAHAFSESAIQKIQQIGGKTEIITSV